MRHIVIGGGIIGLLTAYYLRKAGHDVVVMDKSKMGSESSWAGGGILSPLYPWRYPDSLTRLVQYSQSLYPDLIDQLQSETDIEIEYQKSSMLVLDDDEINAAQQWSHSHHINLDVINDRDILKVAPNLNKSILNKNAVLLPDVGQVRNPRLLKGLIHHLKNCNVELIDNISVENLLIDDDQVKGVQTNHGKYYADTTTVACGAWSPKLIDELANEIKMEPVRGQMILFKASPELLKTIVMLDSHYLIPRKDGRILAGSTLEYVGYQKETTQQAADELHQRAVDLVPDLKRYEIENHWAGLRPGAPRSIPVIGPHPIVNSLFINTCHFRNGVVTAPGSAKLLADHILDKKSTLDVGIYTI